MKKAVNKKIAEFFQANYGKTIKYRRQELRIDAVSHLGNGIYCIAIENGRVQKGDAQFVEWRYLRKFA